MPNRDCLIKQRNKTKLTYRNFSSYRRKIKPDNLRRKVYGNFLKNKRKSHGGGLVDISDGRSIRIGTDGSQHRARNLRPGPPRAPGGRGQRCGSGESREVERVENAGPRPQHPSPSAAGHLNEVRVLVVFAFRRGHMTGPWPKECEKCCTPLPVIASPAGRSRGCGPSLNLTVPRAGS